MKNRPKTNEMLGEMHDKIRKKMLYASVYCYNQ